MAIPRCCSRPRQRTQKPVWGNRDSEADGSDFGVSSVNGKLLSGTKDFFARTYWLLSVGGYGAFEEAVVVSKG